MTRNAPARSTLCNMKEHQWTIGYIRGRRFNLRSSQFFNDDLISALVKQFYKNNISHFGGPNGQTTFRDGIKII